MNKLILSLSILAFFSFPKHILTQCPPSKTAYLHINNIRATIGNLGGNFIDQGDAGFQVPYTGPESPATLFASGLWLTGKDIAGNQKLSVNGYVNQGCSYHPGPLSNSDIYDLEYGLNWNRTFTVTGQEIKRHLEDYYDDQLINDTLASVFGWPGKGNEFFEAFHGFELTDNIYGLAPFYDLNENGNYEPDKGDHPVVSNAHTLWHESSKTYPDIIMWSVYNTGGEDSIPNFGNTNLEIHQTSWAFNCGDELVDNTIFTQYKMISRNSEPLLDFKTGFWHDPDLGCIKDDYIGCFPELNTFYIYNRDNDDEENCGSLLSGIKGYGPNPPVQTVSIWGSNSWSGSNSMDGFYYSALHTDPLPYPYYGQEYVNRLHGKWWDATPFTYGGNGYDPASDDVVQYVFPDSPSNPDGWSMTSSGIPLGDYRILAVNNYRVERDTDTIYTLEPGAVFSFDLAYSFFRNEDLSNIEIVDYAKSRIPDLEYFYKWGVNDCYTELCDCDCLWPAESNKDGIVDYLDAVNIYKYWGESGPKRNKALAWIGSDEADWAQQFSGNLNPKYADANGDGTVDSRDIDLVETFKGNKNYCFEKKDPVVLDGDELYWYNVELESDFEPQKGFLPYLGLKSENDFWGISFELHFDPQYYRLLNHKNKIGWENDQVNPLIYEEISKENGYLKIIYFNDQLDNRKLINNSNNELINLVLVSKKLADTISQTYTEILVKNALIYYKNGLVKPIPAERLRIKLRDDVKIESVDIVEEEIDIYPNPTSSVIYFSRVIEAGNQIKVVDMHGKVMMTNSLKSEIEYLELNDLPSGAYMLHIQTNSGKEHVKLLTKL